MLLTHRLDSGGGRSLLICSEDCLPDHLASSSRQPSPLHGGAPVPHLLLRFLSCATFGTVAEAALFFGGGVHSSKIAADSHSVVFL